MFDLEKQIAQWRQQMIAGGIKNREVLRELESHLREDIEQQTREGVEAQEAFDSAVERIGRPEKLRSEFMKTRSGSLLWKLPVLLKRWLNRGDKLPSFDQFNPESLLALSVARSEAPRLRHDFIGTEHLLFGLTKSGNGAKLLARMGMDSAKVTEQILVWVKLGQPTESIPAQIPYTPRAKRALSLAAREAEALNQRQIGPEHILLGLILEGHGVAALIFQSLGVNVENLRAEIRRGLSAG